MLKSLTVSNFKAFEQAVTIDFSAIGNYEFNTEAIENGIVKTSVMYGKNASGKSSLALAIFDIVSNLTDNFGSPANYSIYLNANNLNKPAEFTYVFTFQDKEIIYQYKKTSLNSILFESLTIDNHLVIFYDKMKKDSSFIVDLKGTENLNRDLPNLQISALKWVKNNSSLEKNLENEIFVDLFEFVNKMLLFWALQDRSFVGYSPVPGANIVEKIIKNNHFEDFKQFFKDAGITDEIVHNNRTGVEKLYLKFGNTLIDFDVASSQGMKSLLLVYYWLEDAHNSSKCPSFVCIDEFDAFYHFELSTFIIERLKSLNCQVLLTTHNTSIFSNDLLRPDCYYICTKRKVVNAHNATDKELREGHNLEKLYRGGTFGL